MAEHLQDELKKFGVASETIRIVDHDIKPGVEKDMGDGDEWPAIREKILAADILIFSTPTWRATTSTRFPSRPLPRPPRSPAPPRTWRVS
jgi:multimeric flavodoxin WrbA